tara:strand:+ start:230 stop:736 length:507 start_codon:yes stop_codon:yes gene_type:complete
MSLPLAIMLGNKGVHMNTKTKQSAKTQKAITPALQAQLDAVNDMTVSTGKGISATQQLTFGADLVSDKDNYPPQIKLVAKYGAVCIERGATSFNMNDCNTIMLEVEKDKNSPIYQKEGLRWLDKQGLPYGQDVVDISSGHYGARMIGKEVWKSKRLGYGKSEAFVTVS